MCWHKNNSLDVEDKLKDMLSSNATLHHQQDFVHFCRSSQFTRTATMACNCNCQDDEKTESTVDDDDFTVSDFDIFDDDQLFELNGPSISGKRVSFGTVIVRVYDSDTELERKNSVEGSRQRKEFRFDVDDYELLDKISKSVRAIKTVNAYRRNSVPSENKNKCDKAPTIPKRRK